MSGWIAVDREIFGETVFPKEPMSEREAYLWLKANAAWEDTTHRVGSEVLPCPRGSLFITLRDFQTTTSWGSDKKIRGFLLRLQEAGLIRAEARGKRNARKTHVTICNYDIKEDAGRTEDASKTHRGRTEDAVKEEGIRKKGGGGGSAPEDLTFREQIIEAMGHELPGITASGKVICTSTEMEEVGKWQSDLGLSEAEILQVVAETKCRDGPPTSPRFYTQAMQRRAGAKAEPKLKAINGGHNERPDQNTDRKRVDPALEQIARLTGVGGTSGNGGGRA